MSGRGILNTSLNCQRESPGLTNMSTCILSLVKNGSI